MVKGPMVNFSLGTISISSVSSSRPMLFEVALDVGQRELGGVDRNLDLAQDPGQAADVVHVPVGEDDGADMRFVFNQVGDVGNHDIHAQQLRLREHQPGVDHDNVVFPAQGEAVHAELAQTAQGNDFQFFCLHLSDSMLTPMGVECLQSSRKVGQLVSKISLAFPN